jgi:telomerase Cajal body protein 1
MTSKTRKSREGQRGMISALTTSYHHPDIFAAGSYRGSVYLYDARTGAAESEIVGSSHGPNVGGITQLKFSPDGRFLFSASRRGKQVLKGERTTLFLIFWGSFKMK